MNELKEGKYLSELIEAGISNETTEAYKAYEEAEAKCSNSRASFLKPYREALEAAEREFKSAVESLPKYPSRELHALWMKYVEISHKQGFPVWGIDDTGREAEIIEKHKSKHTNANPVSELAR